MMKFKLSLFTYKIARLPLRRKFGFGPTTATESDYVTTNVKGDDVEGVGGSLLMNPWAFPDALKGQSYEIMPALVRICCETINNELRHKRIKYATPPQYWDHFYGACLKAAKDNWGKDFPDLAVSVALAPFEFAIWDAYGKAHDRPWARCVSEDFLGEENFTGVVRENPLEMVTVLHTMGGFDPIDEEDLKNEEVAKSILAKDNLPTHLHGEMKRGGFTCVKPKVFGDLDRNTARIAKIDTMLQGLYEADPNKREFQCYFDANGTIASVEDLRILLRRIAYTEGHRVTVNFEQPFAVDRTFARGFEVDSLQSFCDLSIDEALVNVGDVARAHEMGYTRLGLKACKSVTATLRMAREAQRIDMKFDIQDLTQVGNGLVVSASLAAWLGCPMESNGWKNVAEAVKLMPEGNFGGLWLPEDGCFKTANLTGPGFGVAS